MESEIPSSITILALLLFVSFIFKHFMASRSPCKSLRFPPGPPKLPIIGNLHQFTAQLPHHAFIEMSKKFGPIFQLELGQIPTIVVSNPRLAKEVLTINDIAFAQRPKIQAMGIILYGCTDLAVSEYGDYYKQMKKVTTHELLSATKVQSFSHIREQETSHFVEAIRSSCGSPVHFTQMNIGSSSTMICRVIFADKCKDQVTLLELIQNLLSLANVFELVDLFPDMKFLQVISGKNSTVLKVHQKLDKLFDRIFDEQKLKKNEQAEDEGDLLAVLFRIKDSLEYPVTFDNIKAILIDLLVASTATSSATIDWAMAELMRHPNVMEKAQAEVRESFKGKTTITEADLQGLTYLKMIVKETLRLHPICALIPRECREKCKIDGYDVLPKTRVMVNAYACNHDPEYWEDPESFIPERFKFTKVDFLGNNHEFLAFGAGRRMCPGVGFGLISIELPLAQLLYHFDWKLPDGMKPEDVDMTERNGVATARKFDMNLIPTAYSPV